MKKIIQTFILGLALIPALSWGEEFVNFSIEKNIYANLSSDQQQDIVAKISELNIFFKNDVYPHIPTSVLEKIKDLQVTINFSDKTGRDGLFIPGSENHKHKIIVQLIQINSNGLKSLLAHEFFHAVHFEINANEAPWVREGMAQLFEYIVTNEFNGTNLQAAIMNSLTPLIGNYGLEDINAAQYGHNMLYFYYLYKHCGGDQFFWSMAEGVDELKGAYLIDSILSAQNSKKAECKNFLSSAISFEVAKLHNQIQLTKEEDRERFFLAPTNLSPMELIVNTSAELMAAIHEVPLYSSLRIKLETWNNLTGHCKDCAIFYAKRSFPYDVNEEIPSPPLRNYDIILVKTGGEAVLTEVSSKNTRK
ncbi:MAG: hypothetical protein PHY93_15305 [Bacteriovorax sp.]|nr:hypothetical protein [Bacteriovorax sp.]